MKNEYVHVHHVYMYVRHVCMVKSLMLDITSLVALGFPPACINSGRISVRP